MSSKFYNDFLKFIQGTFAPIQAIATRVVPQPHIKRKGGGITGLTLMGICICVCGFIRMCICVCRLTDVGDQMPAQ